MYQSYSQFDKLTRQLNRFCPASCASAVGSGAVSPGGVCSLLEKIRKKTSGQTNERWWNVSEDQENPNPSHKTRKLETIQAGITGK